MIVREKKDAEYINRLILSGRLPVGTADDSENSGSDTSTLSEDIGTLMNEQVISKYFVINCKATS